MVTKDDKCLANRPIQDDTLSPCNHEEADTRLFVHAYQATMRDKKKSIMIKVNDTDVLVIAINVYSKLKDAGIESL